MVPDISEIGEFVYEWDFDDDSYAEYLEECELDNTEEVLDEYIRENVSFDIAFMDSDTFHEFSHESMSLGDIEDAFGSKFADIVLSDCKKDGEGRCESYVLFEDEEVDVNDPKSLNDAAKRVLRSGDYYKDCRGFILSDGTVVYTPAEHNQCTMISGVKGTVHFIKLGNIRVLSHSIDVGKKPTEEQVEVLRKVISCYSDSELYLDIFDGTEISAKYVRPFWRKVIADIMRYYDEGIRPIGSGFYESVDYGTKNTKKKMNKKLIRLTESDLHRIVKESVNKVLTELDWRTYANAAKKRESQIQQLGRDATDKGGNRLTRLRNNLDHAASDVLTSKYAQRNNNGYPTNNADVWTNNGYQTVTTNNFNGSGKWSSGKFNYKNKGHVDKNGYDMDSKMDDEVEDYMSGKSKYVKGKGWK